MFHTNREKFNTTTDFDENKYTYVQIKSRRFHYESVIFVITSRNVPLPQLSAGQLAEIEKKVQEIERRGPTEDIDEDDAGRQKKKNTIFLQISLFFKRRQTSKRKFESR